MHFNHAPLLLATTTRDHSKIKSSKMWVGGVKKMAIFDDLQYCKSSKSWVGGPKKVDVILEWSPMWTSVEPMLTC